MPIGLQSSLETIHLRSNQIEFVNKYEFRGLGALRKLDISFNRIRSIEDGALQSLPSLVTLDLSGNNWSCDCYMRSLKNYLSRTAVHRGQAGELKCGEGGDHSGKEIDNLQESQLTCEPVQFTVELLTSDSALVQWNEPQRYTPPYVSFKLNLSGVTDTGEIL
jgi:hypothetical protein